MKLSSDGMLKVEQASAGVVSLSKGQKVSLAKVDPALKKIKAGLGWDINRYDGQDFDLDASVFMCDAHDKCSPENFIFYNNKVDIANSVIHEGDNRTGEGEGDDEVIHIDLAKVPVAIESIYFTVTIHEADVRHQKFGDIEHAFIRLVNKETDKEIIRCDLTEDYDTETALVIAKLYRHNGEWKFGAICQGFAGGLAALCNNYGIAVE